MPPELKATRTVTHLYQWRCMETGLRAVDKNNNPLEGDSPEEAIEALQAYETTVEKEDTRVVLSRFHNAVYTDRNGSKWVMTHATLIDIETEPDENDIREANRAIRYRLRGLDYLKEMVERLEGMPLVGPPAHSPPDTAPCSGDDQKLNNEPGR